ncbi:protein disulfide-isomerase A6 homolog [Mya arenaria]|uniref:protein disulfide-isomerase A6 homolog n=1 Tax=Mya arenaria TaxID=6604 RepID=UPI0022E52EB3|nr:protein disulfide-isomerase A6 homolog [Mya arenaria]XP_052765554.1 protein disulfide-isomerase A6 homolog [Mya arenaria]
MDILFVGVLVALATHGSCMYSSSDDVVELTPSNFNNLVLNSDEVWLVEFYAPWCGHCQSLAGDWKKAATALKGVVKVGAVNADDHQSLGGQYGVKGFPTIKVFGLDKKSPTDYQGPRQASGIVDAALNAASSMAKQRLSGKRGSGGSSGGGGGSGKKADPADVIELTDSNFQELVINSEDIWLVEFFAPWCGHCKNLAPQWAQAATDLKGKVKLGAVDSTVHTVISSRYGIRGYPTIKYFPGGKKDGEAQEYDGGRTASDIVSWANQKAAENVPPPDVYEITSQKVLSDNCDDRQLCIVSILPHILDCQSQCRNKYIKALKAVGEHFKAKMWGWVWAEAGAQPALEEGLGIGGFGYPAMAAINSRKMKYALLRGSFAEQGIKDFLRDLSYGRGSTNPITGDKLPSIEARDPWDGKDGELPQEEDIDLSDVELDDLDEPSKDEL